ncbi:hypothetical protein HanIR_Chr17g0895991 [Helianthus annuus]|nr:hypothetical protein HanIR_Chr17g0895991 [Helianthus annuus]
MGKRLKSYASFSAFERRKQHSRKTDFREAVAYAQIGRRLRPLESQFLLTGYFAAYGGFWLRVNARAVAYDP